MAALPATDHPQAMTRPRPAVNRYFLYPFLAWAITGGALLAMHSREELFLAINSRHSGAMDMLMSACTHLGEGGPIIAILMITLGAFFRSRNRYLLTALACNAMPAFVIQLLKDYFSAPRPLRYFGDHAALHIDPAWSHLYDRSFPSGHSGGAFSLFFFLSLLLPLRWQPLGLLFFFVALATAYSRVYLAAHFFADIYFGSLIGGGLTWLAFYLMRFPQPAERS